MARSYSFSDGGTQSNLISLAAILSSIDAVIAPASAHICLHEAGAIEALENKIIEVPSFGGKITPAAIRQICAKYNPDIQMVKPKVVSVSQPTEIGTVYSLFGTTSTPRSYPRT